MDGSDRSPTCEQQERNGVTSNDHLGQSHPRPIPSIFPRYPYTVSETFTTIARNECVDNIPPMAHQNPSMEGPSQQGPFYTTFLQPVGLAVASNLQKANSRIVYASPPVPGVAIRPYMHPVYCSNVMTSHHAARYSRHTQEIMNTNQQVGAHDYRPSLVSGIPPDPSATSSTPWGSRCCRPYDLLLQPEAMRVFNDYKNGPPSPRDKKPRDRNPHQLAQNRTKSLEGKSNGTVHIGGLLTLPKQVPLDNEESSQNSSSSSVKEEEQKPAYLRPGIMLFRKLAQAGLQGLMKTVVKYGVKSSKEDLESLCEEVRSDLQSSHNGVLQMEAILREIIMAYVRICSSWSSLVNVLPMREQPHPIEDCLNPLVKEFSGWQEASTLMLQAILDALDGLPMEHERCISGLPKIPEDRLNGTGEDGDNAFSHLAPNFKPDSRSHVTRRYSPLPGYMYPDVPGCDTQQTAPSSEDSPNIELDDPLWAHLYPQLDSE